MIGSSLARTLLVAGAVAVSASACNFTVSHSAHAGPSAAVPTPTSVSAPVSAAVSPSGVAGVAGVGAGPGGAILACTNLHLKVRTSTSEGAAGTLVNRFVVTNMGAHTCSLYGHPGISPYGKAQQGGSTVEANLPGITVDHIPAGFGDLGGAATHVLVPPAGTAVFFIKSSDVPVGNGPCPKADGFAFTAPPASSWDASPTVVYAFQPCGGHLSVSAILPSTVGH